MQRVVLSSRNVGYVSYDKHGVPESQKLLQALLKAAISRRAHVMHLEPGTATTTVRYRVDNKMLSAKPFSGHLHGQLVAALKQVAELDQVSSLPQDGTFETKVGQKNITASISFLPTEFGERVVVHLDNQESVASLESLGFWGQSLNDLQHMVAKPKGLLLIGSDNQQASYDVLSAILKLLEHPSLTIAKVHNHKSTDSVVPQATKLQLALQGDPDIVAISALNAKKLFNIALEAAQHRLVIGIVPASSPGGVLFHTRGWASERYDLARYLLGSIFVESTALLCEHCHEKHIFTAAEEAYIVKRASNLKPLIAAYGKAAHRATPPGSAFTVHSGGCKHCSQSGTNGKIDVVQANPINEKIQKELLNDSPSLQKIERVLRESVVVSLAQDKRIKALCGSIQWKSSYA